MELKKNMNGNKEHDMPDPEKIKEILDVVAEKIPGLLKELRNLLYSPESSKNFATSAATFYKKLIEAGMNENQAFELTKQYMSTLNIGGMMKNINAGNHMHQG